MDEKMQEKPVEEKAASGQAPEMSSEETAKMIQLALQQMQSQFETIAETVLKRIDEMGERVNVLEKSLDDVCNAAGIRPPSSS